MGLVQYTHNVPVHLKIVHAAFIVEFFHKCEEGFKLTKVFSLNQCITHICTYIVGTQMYMYSQRIIVCALVPQQWAFPSHVGKGDMALKQCTIQADSSIWLCCH